MKLEKQMNSIEQKVDFFLSQERIAVAGVSHTSENPANMIYRKLKKTGKTVIPVNPNADSFDGDTCYQDVKSIPEGVRGVVIVTRPEITELIVRECAEAGVRMVWMHRSLEMIGGGSVSEEAVEFCRENGIEVIAGACPMMFCKPVDIGHKCIGWIMKVSGRMPT